MVVAVAFKGWSFTRGSNCKALTGKVLVFWIAIGCHLWEVVAHGGSKVNSNNNIIIIIIIIIMIMIIVICELCHPGGGGYSHIWAIHRYGPRNRVWFLRFSVLK